MISKFLFKNWKSHRESTLHIDPLTILIGTNASGKSNALDALLFLNRVAMGAQLTAALQGEGTQMAVRGGIEWAARRPGNTFSLEVTVRATEQMDYEYRLDGHVLGNRCDLLAEQLIRIKYRATKDGARSSESGRINLFTTDSCDDHSPTIVARLYNEKRGSPRPLSRANAVLYQLMGQKPRQEIEDGVAAVLEALKNIFVLDPIPSHMRGYSALSERLEPDAANIAGVLAALPADKKEDIESTLTRFASKLPEKDIRKVYAEPVGKFGSDAMLYCDEHWGNSKENAAVDARGMSDGSLRFLAILTALLTRPQGSLLIIEEVDNGLHPSRAQLLLHMLKEVGGEREVDVVVTTHNPALLDAMGTEMVPFISVAHRDPTTGDSLLTLLEDIADLPKLLAQGTVGRLSSRGLIEASLHSEQGKQEAGV
ncbi:ATPase [Zobellella taiwanensis]|uniref:ATPase n=1 Tax=Zobellella taiwanensis TaxID=347535 RepID=A0A2P7R1Z4_9GAMM|nr:ATP-binding protein [Zobellella taiwanensis]PSJ44243.1 ATPase [Zobellella taiwanensis]